MPPETTLAEIAALLGVSVAQLAGRDRTRAIVEARQLAAYVLHVQHPRLTQQAIGELLGGREHATIAHAWAQAPRLLAFDPARAAQLAPLLPPAREPPTLPARAMRWWATQARAEYLVAAA